MAASRHLPLGVCLFLSLFAVCRRFSLQPSCHPAVFLLSTFSLPSLLPLSLRSPLPRSASPLLPVGPLLSRLFLPLGAVPLSSLRIVAPQVYPAHLVSRTAANFAFLLLTAQDKRVAKGSARKAPASQTCLLYTSPSPRDS